MLGQVQMPPWLHALLVRTNLHQYNHLFSQSRNRCTSTVFVHSSLVPDVLISLPMVCGRNALARVRQSARTSLVDWLVALPQVELNTTLADVTRIPLNNAHNKSLAN